MKIKLELITLNKSNIIHYLYIFIIYILLKIVHIYLFISKSCFILIF